jgi:hypothetical protein
MANQVLRTVYLDPAVDDELRTEAFDTRTPKDELIRQYLKLGMQAVHAVKASTHGEGLTLHKLAMSPEPAYYRYRHSLEEKWHYGPTPKSWWECQPLYATAEPAVTHSNDDNLTSQARDFLSPDVGLAVPQPDRRHVGDSYFEGWYQEYAARGEKNPKQIARDAYAAGMGDTTPQPSENPRETVAHTVLTAGLGTWLNQVTAEDWAALRRFYECVEDGEGYDVPLPRMARLADIGLVRKVRGTVYEFTQLGLALQNYDPAEAR